MNQNETDNKWEKEQKCTQALSNLEIKMLIGILKVPNLIIFFIFMPVLVLCCFMGFSLVVASGEYSLAVGHRLLTAVASLLTEHRLSGTRPSGVAVHGLSSCGTWAQLLHTMWDLPCPGIEPMSLALAKGFFTPEPPGKPPNLIINH